MELVFEGGLTRIPTSVFRNFVEDLGASLHKSPEEVITLAGSDASILSTTEPDVACDILWPIARLALEGGLIELLAPPNGLPSVNYDLNSMILLARTPFGAAGDFSRLSLTNRPVTIAGRKVDFPLGVPASILTTNASFIQYYAERGYPILTYKTVRSRSAGGNSFPQWVCIQDPPQLSADSAGELPEKLPTFVGKVGFYSENARQGTMANSFGVPSHDPSWWQKDLAQARAIVREGHQLLIVSVMSSVGSDDAYKIADDKKKLQMIAEDFAITARLASDIGADVVELNFSCPNTKGTNIAGLIYQNATEAAVVAKCVRDALGGRAKVFAKIGYLSDTRLVEFLNQTWRYIDGIVAINTVSAPVLDSKGQQLFPGRSDETAGISGWSIRSIAQRLATKLVAARDDLAKREGKRLDILGLGGVMTKQDFNERLRTGVDAVEICTGGYLNQFLGFEIRDAVGTAQMRATLQSQFSTTGGTMEVPQLAEASRTTRSVNAEARVRPSIGGEPMSRKRSGQKHTQAKHSGAVQPEELRKAFRGYFKKQSKKAIAERLNASVDEILVNLKAKSPRS